MKLSYIVILCCGIRSVWCETVAFSAYIGEAQTNVSVRTPVVYDRVVTNEGNCYDPATGVFTAPTSGVYFFNVVVETKVVNNKTGTIIVHIMAEGEWQVDAIAKALTTGINVQGSNSVIVKLNAGQHVWIETYLEEPQYFEGVWEGNHDKAVFRFNTFTGYRLA